MAVEIRGVKKNYKSLLRNSVTALNNINLHVPAGQIFGLLGPSGCGKTTLLKCIVNRIKPNEGNITVLGKPLGDPESGVPGHNVGYMPQDLTLVLELTIAQTLWYSGHLSCMDTTKLKHRMDYLMEILKLPDETYLIAELSGGQQRRVSFAVALLHEPQLLILDEPTVGLDPLLRVSIWDHLMEIAEETGATVVITTHYIEEARRAHTIGLMRKGRLLVQSPPQELLDNHQMTTMEAVFLHLCREDELNHDSNINVQRLTKMNNETCRELPQSNVTFESQGSPSSQTKSYLAKKLQRIHALIYRNFHKLLRNKLTIFMEIFMASLCLVLYIITMNEFQMNIAVANIDEFALGGLYLQKIDSNVIIQTQHQTRYCAVESVKKSDAWGSIYLNPNFSVATIQRYASGDNVSNETISASNILVQMDMTDIAAARIIQMELITSYVEFEVDLLEYYELNPAIAKGPISFEKPIYGHTNNGFRNSYISGILPQLTFAFAAFPTSLAFIIDHTCGLLDRVWVSGASRSDVTISHFVVQGAIMLCQITLTLVTTFAIYQIPSEGPLTLIAFILFLVGINGISFGYLISTIVPTVIAAFFLQISHFIVSVLLIGVLWPIDAMPQWIRYIAYTIPTSLPAESIKSIMFRDWTTRHFQIWLSCATTIAETLFNIAISQFMMYIRE